MRAARQGPLGLLEEVGRVERAPVVLRELDQVDVGQRRILPIRRGEQPRGQQLGEQVLQPALVRVEGHGRRAVLATEALGRPHVPRRRDLALLDALLAHVHRLGRVLVGAPAGPAQQPHGAQRVARRLRVRRRRFQLGARPLVHVADEMDQPQQVPLPRAVVLRQRLQEAQVGQVGHQLHERVEVLVDQRLEVRQQPLHHPPRAHPAEDFQAVVHRLPAARLQVGGQPLLQQRHQPLHQPRHGVEPGLGQHLLQGIVHAVELVGVQLPQGVLLLVAHPAGVGRAAQLAHGAPRLPRAHQLQHPRHELRREQGRLVDARQAQRLALRVRQAGLLHLLQQRHDGQREQQVVFQLAHLEDGLVPALHPVPAAVQEGLAHRPGLAPGAEELQQLLGQRQEAAHSLAAVAAHREALQQPPQARLPGVAPQHLEAFLVDRVERIAAVDAPVEVAAQVGPAHGLHQVLRQMKVVEDVAHQAVALGQPAHPRRGPGPQAELAEQRGVEGVVLPAGLQPTVHLVPRARRIVGQQRLGGGLQLQRVGLGVGQQPVEPVAQQPLGGLVAQPPQRRPGRVAQGVLRRAEHAHQGKGVAAQLVLAHQRDGRFPDLLLLGLPQPVDEARALRLPAVHELVGRPHLHLAPGKPQARLQERQREQVLRPPRRRGVALPGRPGAAGAPARVQVDHLFVRGRS